MTCSLPVLVTKNVVPISSATNPAKFYHLLKIGALVMLDPPQALSTRHQSTLHVQSMLLQLLALRPTQLI